MPPADARDASSKKLSSPLVNRFAVAESSLTAPFMVETDFIGFFDARRGRGSPDIMRREKLTT